MRSPFATSRSQVVAASPEAVLEVVRDPATWPEWQSEVTSARGPRPLRAGDVVEGSAAMLGFDVRGRSVITATSEGGLEQDVLVGVYMRVTFAVEKHARGAVVTHSLRADLPRGLLGIVLSMFLRRRLVAMQRATLTRLADQAEGWVS